MIVFNASHSKNNFVKSVTEDTSKNEKSTCSKERQFLNMFLISTKDGALIFEQLINFNELQLLKIPFILIKFGAFTFDKSIDSKEVQYMNI